MAIRSRTIQGGQQLQAHYFMSSVQLGVKVFDGAGRDNWEIVNLHWTLVLFLHRTPSEFVKTQARNCVDPPATGTVNSPTTRSVKSKPQLQTQKLAGLTPNSKRSSLKLPRETRTH